MNKQEIKKYWQEVVSQEVAIANVFVQKLELPPGTYIAKDVHTMLKYKWGKFYNRSKRNTDVYKILTQDGYFSIPLTNIFDEITKAERRAGCRGKNRARWNFLPKGEVTAKACIKLPERGLMIKLSKKFNKIIKVKGDDFVTINIKDGEIFKQDAEGNQLSIPFQDFDGSGLPNIVAKIYPHQLAALHDECVLKVYYEEQVGKYSVVIECADGTNIGSVNAELIEADEFAQEEEANENHRYYKTENSSVQTQCESLKVDPLPVFRPDLNLLTYHRRLSLPYYPSTIPILNKSPLCPQESIGYCVTFLQNSM